MLNRMHVFQDENVFFASITFHIEFSAFCLFISVPIWKSYVCPWYWTEHRRNVSVRTVVEMEMKCTSIISISFVKWKLQNHTIQIRILIKKMINTYIYYYWLHSNQNIDLNLKKVNIVQKPLATTSMNIS